MAVSGNNEVNCTLTQHTLQPQLQWHTLLLHNNPRRTQQQARIGIVNHLVEMRWCCNFRTNNIPRVVPLGHLALASDFVGVSQFHGCLVVDVFVWSVTPVLVMSAILPVPRALLHLLKSPRPLVLGPCRLLGARLYCADTRVPICAARDHPGRGFYGPQVVYRRPVGP